MRLNRIICLLLLFSRTAFSQIGGKNAFEFINVASNAKVSGLGGMNISIKDHDPNMFLSNPALLNNSMVGLGSMNYLSYYADIWNTSLVYAFNTKKAGLFGVGLQYLNYGSTPMTDASGNVLGTISANEYAVTVSKSHTVENYTLGANVKFAGSQIAGYTAFAALADVGGVFKHPTKQLTIGLLFKNIGFPLKNYNRGEVVSVPFDVQAGITFKPAHMPIRFSVTLHHLYRYAISYDDPNNISSYDLNGNPVIQRVSVIDNLFRHVVMGAELMVAKGFNLRAGYNRFVQADLSTTNYGGLNGFSFGAMIKVKVVEIGYTRAFYHAAGGNNYFTLLINFGSSIKKTAPSKEVNPGS